MRILHWFRSKFKIEIKFKKKLILFDLAKSKGLTRIVFQDDLKPEKSLKNARTEL